MSALWRFLNNDKKQITRFLWYAVGELILIVVGIYLALQLDNWKQNEERKDAEIEILDEISAGFVKDINDLKFNIFLHQTAAQSGARIIDHFAKNLPYNDSLGHLFAKVLWYSRLVTNDGPFETLKAKGLDLISNDSLRIKITFMYDNQYEGLRAFEKNTFLPDDYMLSVCATRFDKTEIYIPLPDFNFESGVMIPYDYEALKKDRDYAHVVKTLSSKNTFVVEFFMKKTLRQLSSLKEEVDAERKRLRLLRN